MYQARRSKGSPRQNGGDRCSPFFFFKAKKSTTSLKPVEDVNLHSASKALYNMYQWMRPTGIEQDFFTKVRVFSFALNAHSYSCRFTVLNGRKNKLNSASSLTSCNYNDLVIRGLALSGGSSFASWRISSSKMSEQMSSIRCSRRLSRLCAGWAPRR